MTRQRSRARCGPAMQATALVCVVALAQGCMKSVTRYRQEWQDVPVTKTRKVRAPVEQTVEVPYEEQRVETRQRQVAQAVVNPGSGVLAVAFLPFTTSSGRPDDARRLGGELVDSVARHPQAGVRYRFIDEATLRAALDGGALTRISPPQLKKLGQATGASVFVVGHVQGDGEALSCRLEGVDPATGRSRWVRAVSGDRSRIIEQAVALFYGTTAVESVVVPVQRTRTETRVRIEEREETYEAVERRAVNVPYQDQELDATATIGNLILIGILGYAVSASGDKKK